MSDPEAESLPPITSLGTPARWIVLSILLGTAAAFTAVSYAGLGSLARFIWTVVGAAVTLVLACFAVRLMTRESVGLTDRLLYHSFKLGPFRMVREYDLAKVRAVDLMGTRVVRFSYDGMPATLQFASRDEAQTAYLAVRDASNKVRSALPPPEPPVPVPPFSWKSPSVFFLIGANLVPLVGVFALGWDLGSVMVLYWAESGVIGLFNVLKMFRVGGFACVPMVLIFLAHYGFFMLGHLAFTYAFFIGPGLWQEGAEPEFVKDVADILLSLSPALVALFISHGISYRTNFVGRREFVGRTLNQQMGAPYLRIAVMHLTIILGAGAMKGGYLLAPLFILIGLKTAVDLWAHGRERTRYSLS